MPSRVYDGNEVLTGEVERLFPHPVVGEETRCSVHRQLGFLGVDKVVIRLYNPGTNKTGGASQIGSQPLTE